MRTRSPPLSPPRLARSPTCRATRMRPNMDEPLIQAAGGEAEQPLSSPRQILVTVVIAAAEAAVCFALGLGLRRAYYDGAQCSDAAATGCAFEAGKAAGGQHTVILSVATAAKPSSCCSACVQFEGCVAATYLDVNQTDGGAWLPNCLLYDGDAFVPGAEVARADAALCTPPAATRLVSEIAAWMDEDGVGQDEFMIGGAAIIARFGYFVAVAALAVAQSLCGFRGASLPQTVMAPREAALAVTRAAELRSEPAPEAARWSSLAGQAWPTTVIEKPEGGRAAPNDTTQPSWLDIRDALGLSRRQATWSSFSKLILWHWVQPLGYLLVLPFCEYTGHHNRNLIPSGVSERLLVVADYCQLDLDTSLSGIVGDNLSQGNLAIIIAVREVVYLVVSLIAALLCPAYLLVEMGTVKSGETQIVEVKRWCTYLCQPQSFVTLCLAYESYEIHHFQYETHHFGSILAESGLFCAGGASPACGASCWVASSLLCCGCSSWWTCLAWYRSGVSLLRRRRQASRMAQVRPCSLLLAPCSLLLAPCTSLAPARFEPCCGSQVGSYWRTA